MEKKIILAIDDKIDNLKTKIVPRKVNFAVKDYDVVANLKELRSKVTFVPINKAANIVGIICSKRLHVLVIAKQLGFNSENNNDKNGTHVKIYSIMQNDIIS